FAVEGELRAEGGFGVSECVDLAIVPEGVGLHAGEELVRGNGQLKEFVAAIHVFDASPDGIPFRKFQSAFREVAVEGLRLVEGAGASPEEGAGPIAAGERTVVADGGGGAELVVGRRENFGTDDAGGGKLGDPVGGRRGGEAGGVGVDAALVDVPAIFVRLTAVKAGGFETELAVGETRGDDVGSNVRGVFEM